MESRAEIGVATKAGAMAADNAAIEARASRQPMRRPSQSPALLSSPLQKRHGKPVSP